MIRILFRHRTLADEQREPLEVENHAHVVCLPDWVVVWGETGQTAYYPIETIQAVLSQWEEPFLYHETWP